MSLRAASQILHKTKNFLETQITNLRRWCGPEGNLVESIWQFYCLLKKKHMKLARAHNRSVGTSPFKHWKMNVHRWCCLLLCRLFQSLVGKPGPCMIFSLRTTLTPLFRSLSRFSARVDPTLLKHSRKLVWLTNKSTSILLVFPPNPFFVVPCCMFFLIVSEFKCFVYYLYSAQCTFNTGPSCSKGG